MADVGVDDEVDSGTMTATTTARPVGSATGLDITGKQQLQLVVTGAGNGNGSDHGDWADARVTCN